MVKPIIIYGNSLLREKSESVNKKEDISLIIEDMKDTLLNIGGLGISAIQIGIKKRIILLRDFNVEIFDEDNPVITVVINPKIIEESTIMQEVQEGCLSVPNIFDVVKRPYYLKVSFFNENFEKQELEITRLDAAVFKHEVDHLEGKLFVDYLNRQKRRQIDKYFNKLNRGIKNAVQGINRET